MAWRPALLWRKTALGRSRSQCGRQRCLVVRRAGRVAEAGGGGRRRAARHAAPRRRRRRRRPQRRRKVAAEKKMLGRTVRGRGGKGTSWVWDGGTAVVALTHAAAKRWHGAGSAAVWQGNGTDEDGEGTRLLERKRGRRLYARPFVLAAVRTFCCSVFGQNTAAKHGDVPPAMSVSIRWAKRTRARVAACVGQSVGAVASPSVRRGLSG